MVRWVLVAVLVVGAVGASGCVVEVGQTKLDCRFTNLPQGSNDWRAASGPLGPQCRAVGGWPD